MNDLSGDHKQLERPWRSVGTDWWDQIEADRLCVVWVSVLCFSSVLLLAVYIITLGFSLYSFCTLTQFLFYHPNIISGVSISDPDSNEAGLN